MKEFVKNSECFFNFIEDIQGVKNRRQVLNQLVEDIRDYLDAEHCTLLLFDPDSKQLVSRVAQSSKKIRIPLEAHSLTGYCFKTGKTLCVDDVHDAREINSIDPGLHISDRLDQAYHYATKCALLTPVIARGQKVGVFIAMNKPGGFINYSVKGAVEFTPLLGLAVEIVLLDEALKKGKSLKDLPF